MYQKQLFTNYKRKVPIIGAFVNPAQDKKSQIVSSAEVNNSSTLLAYAGISQL